MGQEVEGMWGGGGGGREEGPGQKTSNLSPCPVPLVVKLKVKCRGSVETDAYVADFGSEWTDGFKRHTARGAQTRPRTELTNPPYIFLVTTCGIESNCRAING